MSVDDGELGHEQWAGLLDDVEPATHGEVLLALEDRLELPAETARDMVDAALEAGVITLDDSGTYTTLSVPEDVRGGGATPPEDDDEETQADDEADERHDSGGPPSYASMFADARERAGVEEWELVPEPFVREAFAEHNLGALVSPTHGLDDTDRWVRADLSDVDCEYDAGWYYSDPDDPKPDPEEFRRFHELLTDDAPDGYVPHYFRVERASKGPATRYGSWKTESARLTVDEAVEWMKQGGNVGIAGTPDDPLVNMDVDDDEETTPDDHPTTLRARSRSRSGYHGWYFNPDGDVPNIPTDTAGEIRTDWQFVVAPGSFVASAVVEISEEYHDDSPGFYTIEEEAPVGRITYDDLPAVFKEYHEEIEAAERESEAEHASTDGDAPDGEDDGFHTPGSNGSEADARSAVFDVSAEDVVRKEGGSTDTTDRFSSAFHGSSTSANMSLSDEGRIQCWRHLVAHGGLQALAVLSKHSPGGDTACSQIGKGHKNSGGGMNRYKRKWELTWWGWEYAKRNGYVPSDDPVPNAVIVGLALKHDHCEPDDLVEYERTDGSTFEGLTPDVYNETLETIETEYGLDPGREPLGLQSWTPEAREAGSAIDREPVSAVPFDQVAELNDDEARRLLTKRGVEWPSTDEVRDRLHDRMMQAFRAGEDVVINAPTSVGKSHLTASEPWLRHTNITGDHPVIHLSKTRDARDECIATSEEAGVSAAALKGRKDLCPVARRDHDPAEREDRDDPEIVLTMDGIPASKWIDIQCDNKGNPFQLAHSYVAEHNDQDIELPCCEGELECLAMTQWEGVPRDDEGNPAVDVVHATHQFAYVPGLRAHTNVVIDEAPNAFDVDLPQEQIRKAVNAYLGAINAPVKTFEGLVTLAESSTGAGDIGAERDALENMLGNEPDREWYLEHPAAHALAADLTRAIYRAIRWEDPDTNGRRSAKVIHHPPRFDENHDEGFGGNFLTVVIDDENTIRSIRHAPDFSRARSVVGLDAHPCEPLWQRNAGPQVDCESLLTPDERRLWRRFERGLTVVQVGEHTRPRSGEAAGEWDKSDTKLDKLIQALRDRYGRDFRTGITARAVEGSFRERYDDAGVGDPGTMHYGEEMSRNDFSGEPVGLINGCIDPGDDYVIDLLAELGLDATPERADPADRDDPTTALCAACGGRRCSECNQTGLRRQAGRGFVGPDADVAAELLASVRENHVAQAAGRYARNPDDLDDTAIVYVRTDAIPDGFADVKVNGVEWVATDLQREIIGELVDRGNDGATVQGLKEDVGCGSSHTADTLNRLEERGLTERKKGRGPNPDRWFATIDTLEHGGVDQVELLERQQKTAESSMMAETLDIDGKASGPTYKNPICPSGSFSAENGELSGATKIDTLVAGAADDNHPGPLAVPVEELQDVYELS